MRALLLFVCAVLLCLPASSVRAHHMALRFNLEEMAAASETIFYGECESIVERFETLGGGSVPVTVYTFAVTETLRGKPQASLSIKALGHAAKKASGKPGEILVGGKPWSKESALHDMPSYEVGREYVVFLTSPDSWGLQIPVGRSQGSFSVTVRTDGTRDVRNTLDNRALFTAAYTGFALQRGSTLDPADLNATAGRLSTVPDAERLLRRKGPIDLEIFLDITRAVVAGL